MSAPDARVEMYYAGAWHDIIEDYDSRSPITVSYGQPAEHGEATPTDLQVPLENQALLYSPKDPNSPLFGLIGTGTPLRLRIGDPQAALELPGTAGSYVSTPDTAALDITGDIDVRIDVRPASWRPDATTILMAKTEGPFSWVLELKSSGKITFDWTVDGTLATRVAVSSTTEIPETADRLAVRATLDVNNGFGGKEVAFYTAPTIAGPWTQLGAAVVSAGTTSIFASSAALAVGAGSNGGTLFTPGSTLAGRVYAAEVRNGINGTVVAAPDFSVLDPDTEDFSDSPGRVWTLHSQASVGDVSIRASGTITRFAPGWNRTARDNRVKLTASGPLLDMGKGDDPLRSSLYRDLSTKDSVVAYWPMEDSAGATSLASGITGHPPMVVVGAVNLASYSGFAASEPIPTFTAPGAGLASYANGTIPAFTPAADQRAIGLVHVPDSGVTVSERALITVRTTGTVKRWTIGVTPAGELRVTAFDGDNVQIVDSGAVAFAMNGRHCLVSLLLQQVGADIDWQVSTFDVTGAVGVYGETLNSRTYGRMSILQAGPSFDLGGSAVGHLGALNGDVDSVWDVAGQSLVGWAGETAAERIDRLTREAGLPLRLIGDLTDAELVGAQGVSTLLTLLDEAADADMGLLGERRDHPSLLYRTRASLYNQTPALTLDAAEGHIANPLDTPLDTRGTASAYTVRRVNGSSYTAVDETATTQSPDGTTINLYTDDQLKNQATWRLHLGMVDEHRIASLVIEMHHNPDLVQAILDLEVGSLIRILNPPPGLPPGPLDLIARGWSDNISDQEWYVTINCTPGSPWTVGVVSDGSDEQRIDTDGSEVVADFEAGADTSLSVAVTKGPLWTTDPGDFPFEIVAAGAALEVTAVSGDMSPQTFTITATPVNGIVKTIPAGADVRLRYPMIIAL